MQQFLTSYHFASASHNGRMAGKLEEAYQGDMEEVYHGERFKRWQPIHDSHVISSLISAFSGLEAGINEFWEDPPWKAENADLDRLRWFESEFFEEYRSWRPSTLEKYDIALKCAGCEPFDKGKEPYQSVELLRQIRNYLIHYQPDIIRDEKDSLANALQSKGVDQNPFREYPEGEPLRVFGYLSYGCSKWALKSSLEFFDSLYNRMGARSRLETMKDPILAELKVGWEETKPRSKR